MAFCLGKDESGRCEMEMQNWHFEFGWLGVRLIAGPGKGTPDGVKARTASGSEGKRTYSLTAGTLLTELTSYLGVGLNSLSRL